MACYDNIIIKTNSITGNNILYIYICNISRCSYSDSILKFTGFFIKRSRFRNISLSRLRFRKHDIPFNTITKMNVFFCSVKCCIIFKPETDIGGSLQFMIIRICFIKLNLQFSICTKRICGIYLICPPLVYNVYHQWSILFG